jgi:hypothetical protein
MRVVSSDVVRECTTSLDTTRPSTTYYRLLLNWASQKALGTLPDDSTVMPKHLGNTVHN